MNGIMFAAYVEGIRTRKDKTCAITISTQEINPQKAGDLFSANGHLVTCYLSIKEHISDEQKEIIDAVEAPTQGKTPSQRLRNVLYVLWQNTPEGYDDFNLFYIHKIEKMIEHIKLKLPK